jgi:D-amino-acid dehydrogenase
VTLLEKGDLCAGSSYGNAGWLAYGYILPLPMPGALTQGLKWLLDASSPFYIKPRWDVDLLHWLWQFQTACSPQHMQRAIPALAALNLGNMALFQELAAQSDLDFGYEAKGLLRLFTKQADFQKSIKKARLLRQHGIASVMLDLAGVRHFEPYISAAVVGGLYFPNHAHLIPGCFVQALAQVAQAKGVCFKTGTEVLDFDISGGRIATVRTTQGDFRAEQVVLAAGAWSAPLARKLGLRLPVQAAKGYGLIFKRPPACPRLPLSLADVVAVTPMGDTLRCTSTLELVGLDPTINQRRLAATRRMVHHYISDLDDLELVETWCGFRPTTPDGLPLFGRSPTLENLIIATGHGMLGITQGPLTGQVVAQLVAQQPPSLDLTPFRPERFGNFRRLAGRL